MSSSRDAEYGGKYAKLPDGTDNVELPELLEQLEDMQQWAKHSRWPFFICTVAVFLTPAIMFWVGAAAEGPLDDLDCEYSQVPLSMVLLGLFVNGILLAVFPFANNVTTSCWDKVWYMKILTVAQWVYLAHSTLSFFLQLWLDIAKLGQAFGSNIYANYNCYCKITIASPNAKWFTAMWILYQASLAQMQVQEARQKAGRIVNEDSDFLQRANNEMLCTFLVRNCVFVLTAIPYFLCCMLPCTMTHLVPAGTIFIPVTCGFYCFWGLGCLCYAKAMVKEEHAEKKLAEFKEDTADNDGVAGAFKTAEQAADVLYGLGYEDREEESRHFGMYWRVYCEANISYILTVAFTLLMAKFYDGHSWGDCFSVFTERHWRDYFDNHLETFDDYFHLMWTLT